MINKPEIKGCINRAIEALETSSPEGVDYANFTEWSNDLDEHDQALADLKAFRDTLPKYFAYHKDDVRFNNSLEYVKLTQEAISDER